MFSAVLLAAGLVFSQADADLAYRTAKTLVSEHTPRDAGTIRGRLASNCILDAASAAGADVRRDVFKVQTPNGEKTLINLYAEFSSGDKNARWVVLLSHYDTKPGIKCPGANDGASTSGLLVGLANSLSSWKTPKGNLLCVWTDGEECMNEYGPNDGLWGARRAVDYVESKGMKIQAVVCLDMIGDKDLSIKIPANGSPTLAKIAVHAARRAGYPDLVSLWDEHLKDDHLPFHEKGYKAIGMIDFDYGPNNSYWHTDDDTMDKISVESLLKSGKVVAEMLNILL
jgi:hypothetical protein